MAKRALVSILLELARVYGVGLTLSYCFKVVVDPSLGSGRQRPKPKSEMKAQRLGTQHLKIHSGSEVRFK